MLDSGIEIRVAPPGKIIKSLTLLSGGEQAFVAIALIFAILRVNPTPFCIFDEIEAALDESNVFRFADYVKRYSDKTQFAEYQRCSRSTWTRRRRILNRDKTKL